MNTHFAKLILVIVLGLMFSNEAIGQKFGYIDSQYILEQSPEYQTAMKELEQVSLQWQKELDGMYSRIDKAYQDYRAKEVLLTKDDKDRIQADIMEEEKKAKEYQKKKFGQNGELFKMREEKLKPLQDKVLNAVEKVSQEKKLDVMFDRSSGTTFLYSNPNYDYSKEVMLKLGINPDKAPKEDKKP